MAVDVQASVSRILSEHVCTLAQAREELSEITGRRLDKSTLFRWSQAGVGGIHLETVRIGGQLVTSKEAVHRFIVQRTEAAKR
jgi:hypothetical protein